MPADQWRVGRTRPVDRNKKLAVIKQRYGLEPNEYEQMVEDCDGHCAICDKKTDGEFDLCVDHDHTTGRVRGLLCQKCNKRIGFFKDSPELLRASADYLEAANCDGLAPGPDF